MRILEITDDSGFLALVDPGAYRGFVHADWTLELLLAHFAAEMAERRLLIWGTGSENTWRVAIGVSRSRRRGFREVVGLLRVTQAQLLVTNYESLSMAAQFPDVLLPERHETDQLVRMPSGDYEVRVVQLADPDDLDASGEGDADFLVELGPAKGRAPRPWTSPPWFEP